MENKKSDVNLNVGVLMVLMYVLLLIVATIATAQGFLTEHTLIYLVGKLTLVFIIVINHYFK